MLDALKGMPRPMRANALWELRLLVEREEPAAHRLMSSAERWQTKFYRHVRDRAMMRAQFRCETPGCGSQADLNMHHRYYHDNGTPAEVEAVVILCRSCHANVHGKTV